MKYRSECFRILSCKNLLRSKTIGPLLPLSETPLPDAKYLEISSKLQLPLLLSLNITQSHTHSKYFNLLLDMTLDVSTYKYQVHFMAFFLFNNFPCPSHIITDEQRICHLFLFAVDYFFQRAQSCCAPSTILLCRASNENRCKL